MNNQNNNSKWDDPTYHTLEFMRELSAAENHLIQYIGKEKESDLVLHATLESIRLIRKETEDDLYGRE